MSYNEPQRATISYFSLPVPLLSHFINRMITLSPHFSTSSLTIVANHRYPSLPFVATTRSLIAACLRAPSWQICIPNVKPRTDPCGSVWICLEAFADACFTPNIIRFLIDRVKCQMIHRVFSYPLFIKQRRSSSLSSR